ncbi:FGFR1 oncogene partner-like isoform X6 [Brachionus plicatilis]|uniref:FGFR1 oncogene partner-like isoform X6 n=1 Tax=Brachionus plicatilis TaxID=10195 RepID=A0A3M7Q454_BRAPC|nr:FGFR1 oncogene partner-like isoform X6 [Brachionus plicatilis]
MSCEEEDKEYELKDLIVQTLETNGLLSKIKAQIRANVFRALDDSDKDSRNDQLQNLAAKRALNAPEGRTAASLVRDYLESTNLDYTTSVFDPELNSAVGLEKRDKIAQTLNINESDSSRDLPLLIELLKNYSTGSSNTKTNIFSQNVIDSLKKKFDAADQQKKGSLPSVKASKLLQDLFPNFSKNILETFFNEEFGDAHNLIEFKSFLGIVQKWHNKCANTSKNSENVFLEEKSSDSKSKNIFGIDDDDDEVGDLPPINAPNQNKKTLTIKDLGKSIDDDYEDDFTNGTTPRTPSMDRKGFKNRGGIISDEEIDDNLSYIEESSKIDEVTNDRSISTIHGNNDADYIEDLSLITKFRIFFKIKDKK